MAFNINTIRQELRGGGARQNLFEVLITIKGATRANEASNKTLFMCQAAQLPSSQVGTIQVPYFGRFLKLAGDRTFDPWTVTIINDEDFLIRNAMEEWSNGINLLQANERELVEYKSTAQVTQYSKTGTAIRTYNFEGIFPSAVSSIDLGWDQNDAIETFQVEFQYDYFTVSGPTGTITGN
jgi:hypothetical protein